MKVLNFILILMGFAFFSYISCEVKKAESVFRNCISWQKCYENYFFDNMSDHMNEFFQQRFNYHYLKYKNKLVNLLPFLNDFTQGYISIEGNLNGEIIDDDLRENFLSVYNSVENNMPRFISFLKDHKFIFDGLNDQDQKLINKDDVIAKYRAFSRLIFSNPNKKIEKEILFSFANHCFEYCFNSMTWPDFKQILDDSANYQIARFLYSSIWENFVGRGWKDWSSQILSQIADKSRQGYRVIYVAGGTDIYQLLRYGIYNIDVIDPFLPTQSDFYSSDDWEWLIKGKGRNGGLQDKIEFDFDGLKIEMERKKFTKKHDGSITEWNIFDIKKNYLGSVVFYRRFCEQSDFLNIQKRLILMSFNELYYAFLPNKLDGWGIKTNLLSQDFKIYVKQLRMPVKTEVLENIRLAEDSDFKFIRLGSKFA